FGDVMEDDRHDTLFAEASFAARGEATSWIVGAAVQREAYRSEAFPLFDYAATAPGVFVQVEHDLRDNLVLAASGRWDWHSKYDDRLSPRLSMLYRPGPFTIRASLGKGFYAPTPFVDE